MRFLTKRNLVLLFSLLVIAITAQSHMRGEKAFLEDGPKYSSYNNFVIFQQSFFHLKDGKDLYVEHPTDHYDLFKYSPSFATLMLLFAVLPDGLGLLLWNTLNALFLLWAIFALPKLGEREKAGMCLIVLLELIGSLQNAQSNGIMAGLLIGAFVSFEKEKDGLGTLFIVLSVFIKLFGLVGFALCLLYPRKLKLIGSTLLWVLVIGALPLFFVSFEQLGFLYRSWGQQLVADQSGAFELTTIPEPSVIGWLESWFGLPNVEVGTGSPNKNKVALIGVLLFCIPLLRISNYRHYAYRLLLLASTLIWVVIFNHKAESPTYVIAMSGVAIWFFASNYREEKISKIDMLLLGLALVFVSLAGSDLFPRTLRKTVFIPYVIKVVPCILIWCTTLFYMVKAFSSEENQRPLN